MTFDPAIGLKVWVRAMRRTAVRLTRSRAQRSWRRTQSRNGTIIHPSIEFTGTGAPTKAVAFGANCGVERDVTIWLSPDEGARPTLKAGCRSFIGRNSYIGVYQPITIGANVLVGAYSYVISGNHAYARRDIPIRDQGFTGEAIVIEDDVWIGTHAVVLPGVRIGRGAIVAAGSIVNRNVPAYEIWGGTPAKYLAHRPDGDTTNSQTRAE